VNGLLWIALVGGALALVWRANVEARALANDAAHRACAEARLQLLDGTVAFRRARPARGADGRLTLLRTYVFDYSDDGASRHQGFVILRGDDVEIVGLGPTLVRERPS
jgi:hypothetical protein